MFHFERLTVYQRSIEFLALATRIAAGLPDGTGFLSSQLKSASLSIPNNIAEGCGRPTEPDEKRHYGIARGSAMECVPILAACRLYGTSQQLVAEGRRLLHEIVRMLTSMCRPPESKLKSKSNIETSG